MKIPPYVLAILLVLALYGAYSLGRGNRQTSADPTTAATPAEPIAVASEPTAPQPPFSYMPTTPVQRAEIPTENGVIRVEATASFAPIVDPE